MNNLKTASGIVPFSLHNDYLFKTLMQRDERALRSIISAVLFMKESDIKTVHIENPIILGEKIDEKDVVLDVRITLNEGAILNLEMQVVNHDDWNYRSTYYAARNLSHLGKGEEYKDIKPVYQVGLLEFQPFENEEIFRSVNRIMDVETHRLYTELLTIITVVMPKNDIATPKDREYNLDKWARFFRAKTWEEVRDVAGENTALYGAAETIYDISEDQRIMDQIEAREDRIRRENSMRRRINEAKEQIEENSRILQEQKKQLDKQNRQLDEQNRKLDEKDRQIEELKAIIAEYKGK